MSSSSVVSRPATLSPRRKLLWWLATVLWLCAQAAFSTDTFSAEHTGTILWKIIHTIRADITASQFETIHFLVRKTAHFCTYGLLSVFAFFAWRASVPAEKPWAFRWSALAVATALLAGSLDEFHQSFVPSRTASVRDVLLDVTGAICFQIVLAIILTRRERVPGRLATRLPAPKART